LCRHGPPISRSLVPRRRVQSFRPPHHSPPLGLRGSRPRRRLPLRPRGTLGSTLRSHFTFPPCGDYSSRNLRRTPRAIAAARALFDSSLDYVRVRRPAIVVVQNVIDREAVDGITSILAAGLAGYRLSIARRPHRHTIPPWPPYGALTLLLARSRDHHCLCVRLQVHCARMPTSTVRACRVHCGPTK